MKYSDLPTLLKGMAILILLPFLMAPAAPASRRHATYYTTFSQAIPKLKIEKQKVVDELSSMSFSNESEFDSAFVSLITRYNQAVIDVAKLELEYGKNKNVKKAVQSEIDRDEANIKLLKELLK